MTELTHRRLAERLKGLREHRHLTQVEAAEHLDMSRSTLAMIETGKRRVAVTELVPLAALYRVGVGELLGEPAADDFEELRIVAARLTPEHRDQLVRYGRFLGELEGS